MAVNRFCCIIELAILSQIVRQSYTQTLFKKVDVLQSSVSSSNLWGNAKSQTTEPQRAKKKKKEPTHDNVQQQQQNTNIFLLRWFNILILIQIGGFIVSIVKNNMDLLIYLHFHIMQIWICYYNY